MTEYIHAVRRNGTVSHIRYSERTWCFVSRSTEFKLWWIETGPCIDDSDPLIKLTDEYGAEAPHWYRLSELDGGIDDEQRAALFQGQRVTVGGGACPEFYLIRDDRLPEYERKS